MQINHRHTGDDVTEAQKQAFVRQKTFYCKRLGCRLSIAACEKIQKRSVEAVDWHPVAVCQSCPQFSIKLKKQPRKTCKIHRLYPGTCVGKGYFYRRGTHTDQAWKGKLFCTQHCAARFHHFRDSGWKTVDAVPATYFKGGK